MGLGGGFLILGPPLKSPRLWSASLAPHFKKNSPNPGYPPEREHLRQLKWPADENRLGGVVELIGGSFMFRVKKCLNMFTVHRHVNIP